MMHFNIRLWVEESVLARLTCMGEVKKKSIVRVLANFSFGEEGFQHVSTATLHTLCEASYKGKLGYLGEKLECQG